MLRIVVGIILLVVSLLIILWTFIRTEIVDSSDIKQEPVVIVRDAPIPVEIQADYVIEIFVNERIEDAELKVDKLRQLISSVEGVEEVKITKGANDE